MTINDVLLAILNVVLTSLLTAGFLFISLRYIFGKVFSGFTHLGAKVAGERSGFNRASKAVQEASAKGLLSSPKIAGLKMVASQFGFDIDEMIEDHGAVETLAGITQIMQMVGINPTELLTQGIGGLTKGLNLQGNKPSGELGKV